MNQAFLRTVTLETAAGTGRAAKRAIRACRAGGSCLTARVQRKAAWSVRKAAAEAVAAKPPRARRARPTVRIQAAAA